MLEAVALGVVEETTSGASPTVERLKGGSNTSTHTHSSSAPVCSLSTAQHPHSITGSVSSCSGSSSTHPTRDARRRVTRSGALPLLRLPQPTESVGRRTPFPQRYARFSECPRLQHPLQVHSILLAPLARCRGCHWRRVSRFACRHACPLRNIVCETCNGPCRRRGSNDHAVDCGQCAPLGNILCQPVSRVTI